MQTNYLLGYIQNRGLGPRYQGLRLKIKYSISKKTQNAGHYLVNGTHIYGTWQVGKICIEFFQLVISSKEMIN